MKISLATPLYYLVGSSQEQDNQVAPLPTYILQLDLCIGEPMQICIHRKDNSPTHQSQ